MKKLLFFYFLFYFLFDAAIYASESAKKISFSIPVFSSSRQIDFLIKGTLSVVSLVGLLILKTYVLSRYRRSKMKDLKEEFFWVRTNFDVENYPDGVPAILLKARETLFFGFKELLHQFQKEMDIKDENFVDYLITEAEGENENYLETNHKRKRFVDKNIPGEILDFIDESLMQVRINQTLVDVYSKETQRADYYEVASTQTRVSFITEKRNREELYIAKNDLNTYKKYREKSKGDLFHNEESTLKQHKDFLENKITWEAKEQNLIKKFYNKLNYNFAIFYQYKYLLYSRILHEIGHVASYHSFIQYRQFSRESLFAQKYTTDNFMLEFERYAEFMTDSLLPLLYKSAAKIRLQNSIINAIGYNKNNQNSWSLEEKSSSSIHMSIKSLFVLYNDIAKLHGISLKNCVAKCLKEMYLMNTAPQKSSHLNERSDSIHNNLENIYNSADPEFYTQTYKNKDGIEETFKFPRFLPHVLEKKEITEFQ